MSSVTSSSYPVRELLASAIRKWRNKRHKDQEERSKLFPGKKKKTKTIHMNKLPFIKRYQEESEKTIHTPKEKYFQHV